MGRSTILKLSQAEEHETIAIASLVYYYDFNESIYGVPKGMLLGPMLFIILYYSSWCGMKSIVITNKMCWILFPDELCTTAGKNAFMFRRKTCIHG